MNAIQLQVVHHTPGLSMGQSLLDKSMTIKCEQRPSPDGD